jgi:hypothetical protein
MRFLLLSLIIVTANLSSGQTSRMALCDSIFSCLGTNDINHFKPYTAAKSDAEALFKSLVESGNGKGDFFGRIVSDSVYDSKKKENHLFVLLYFTKARLTWDLNIVREKDLWKIKSLNTTTVKSSTDDPLLLRGAKELPPVFLERYNQLDDDGMYQMLSAQLQVYIPFDQFQQMIAAVRGRIGPVTKQKPESISTFLNLQDGGSSVVKTSVYMMGENETGLLNLQLVMDAKGTFYINSFDFIQGYTCENAEDKRRIELMLVDFYSAYNASKPENMFQLLQPNVQQSTGIDRFRNYVQNNFSAYGEYKKHEWKTYNFCRSIRPDAIDTYMLVVKTLYKNYSTDDIFLLEGTVKGFSILYYFSSIP